MSDEARIREFLEKTGNAGLVEPEWVRLIPGDRWVMAKPLMFHWTVITGNIWDTFGYDDRWCFATADLALAALHAWPEEPAPDYEPEGWHRHPRTERRRVDADPAREYIDP